MKWLFNRRGKSTAERNVYILREIVKSRGGCLAEKHTEPSSKADEHSYIDDGNTKMRMRDQERQSSDAMRTAAATAVWFGLG